VRQLVQTTLLLAGLSLTVSSDLCAEEAPEEEAQSSEEPAADSSEDTQTNSKPQQAILNEEVARDAIPEETMLDARENEEAWLEESTEFRIFQDFNEDFHDELRALSCRRGEEDLSQCEPSERKNAFAKQVKWRSTGRGRTLFACQPGCSTWSAGSAIKWHGASASADQKKVVPFSVVMAQKLRDREHKFMGSLVPVRACLRWPRGCRLMLTSILGAIL